MKGRHPVRIEMKGVWKAEEAMRAKQRELQKRKRELDRSIADLNAEIEEQTAQVNIEVEKLAKRCNVAPSTGLDTVVCKWLRNKDNNDPQKGTEPIDFNAEPNEAPTDEIEAPKLAAVEG